MAFVSQAEAVLEHKIVIVARLHWPDTHGKQSWTQHRLPSAGISWRAVNSATSAYARLPLGGIAEGCWINCPFSKTQVQVQNCIEFLNFPIAQGHEEGKCYGREWQSNEMQQAKIGNKERRNTSLVHFQFLGKPQNSFSLSWEYDL